MNLKTNINLKYMKQIITKKELFYQVYKDLGYDLSRIQNELDRIFKFRPQFADTVINNHLKK